MDMIELSLIKDMSDQQKMIFMSEYNSAKKSTTVGVLLALFLGGFGAHRFYVGKIGTGVLMLITLGGLGVWFLVDLLLVVTGQFTNKDGQKIPRT